MGSTTPSHESAVEATGMPQPEQLAIGVPLGFAAQLRAVQQTQREQAERIAILESENAKLKENLEVKITDLVVRVENLEQHKELLTVRRKELVTLLSNLRTLHLDADNAFQMRAVDIQPDDAEGMLGLCNTQIITTMSHHQRAIAQLRVTTQLQTYPMYHQQARPPVMPPRTSGRYPHWYGREGYCLEHGTPYQCFTCDRRYENLPAPQGNTAPGKKKS
ncbi:hypothetical protein yc1106_06173 [Curvularia clavata]|uniref:Uncharacterized protein n=1 Tax=Curvularia clavata TaxID=95742 RepID=A0A9Q8ZAB5_CURCL|nr:hypothetical protein yc1106_06173 [Curvularia clavata]